MAAPPVSKTVTYEEWLLMPEVKGEEVVNGRIRYPQPPKEMHPLVIENVCSELRKAPNLRIQIVSFGLVIGYCDSDPQLAIEVISPIETRKIKGGKLRDYESIGVPEAWILSPEACTVEVFLLEDGKLRRSAILAEGLLKPRALPGVEIDISKIWPD